ncbi:2541_t:CDS:2 [Paraglomus occultum]|uniref:2541_t:CDS:1 n=1 Tax=Paraglomus occultum TaxID=144539 RepID=A0A9N9AVF4_9GLOM|nr:2541_t:CDS:2 [Paraglomus occultum]
MRLHYAFFYLIAIVASTCIPRLLETPKDAARIARRLVRDTTIGTLVTTMNSEDREGLGGYPFGLLDYYADECPSTGNLLLLMTPLQLNFRNARSNDWKASFSIRQLGNNTFNPVEKPRVNLFGLIEKVPESEVTNVQECFLKAHKDAVYWIPGRSHDFAFYRFIVKDIYYVGGFGGLHYIGWIDKHLYFDANVHENLNSNTKSNFGLIKED